MGFRINRIKLTTQEILIASASMNQTFISLCEKSHHIIARISKNVINPNVLLFTRRNRGDSGIRSMGIVHNVKRKPPHEANQCQLKRFILLLLN